MLGLGNLVGNGKNLSCKSPSFHFFSVLVAFNFHPFSSLYLLILLNLGLILLLNSFYRILISICSLFRPVPLFLNSFAFVFLRLGIVQCFVFLGFLLLLENFGLATLIPVDIRVLGVKTPLRA